VDRGYGDVLGAGRLHHAWPRFVCRRMLGEVTWSEIGMFQISVVACAA
jgi:hypothetical protein